MDCKIFWGWGTEITQQSQSCFADFFVTYTYEFGLVSKVEFVQVWWLNKSFIKILFVVKSWVCVSTDKLIVL